MATISINTGGGSGFLYNNSSGTARLCVTAETGDFDNELLRSWQDEGFDILYVPYEGDDKEYTMRLRSVREGLGVGENYAVMAFGDAASFCLDYYLKPTNANRLCALIAYYPTNIPDTRSRFSPQVRMVVHLAGSTIDVTTVPTALGLQMKRRRQTRQLKPGIGIGERLYLGYPAYTYESVQPGFAEHDLDEYDRLAAELAWSRSLHVLRKAFNRDLDLEKKWEEHLEGKFFSSNISETMDPYTTHVTPTVTCTPTLSGGIGAQALRRFYEQHFLRRMPPSMRLRLISRTVGTDRVVDELYATFEHTHEIPWLLPGVAPTNRKVEIILVSIAAMKAGRLYSEHIYWDQASVLVQIGLLDPKLVPKSQSEGEREEDKVHDRLPVVGREAARRILHEDPEQGDEFHNRLIRRAVAKARGKGKFTSSASTAASVADDSAAEGKSEVDSVSSPVANGRFKGKKGKGKVVQKAKTEARPINVTREEEEEDDEGKEKDQNTDDEKYGISHHNGKAASIEDGGSADEGVTV
ncbi:hypothetical protein ASPZODRAFT_56374 [Penicilliopsis zonata CBS 506.65]|uniref:Dienelactone hydrolase n=1 Tax=Penicilliopsis zonata CBS 506.65 TaxID=1073090 RepID=A0A1L9STT7_9EURO|nr:hypothetical protein ASPZODRAFT_56374 [Penicilliopsis zonata CBS 506.65]OJJ50622.1 hypothetical protein ASPZODRAFT_56374 [Penicilliopsis zonata CBS 506.65]